MRIKLDVPFTLAEISSVTGGKLLEKNDLIYSITTDSRECERGDLFFALKGDNYNGNDFLADARKIGAYTASNNLESSSIFVTSAIDALLCAASAYKKKCAPKFTVAITGSSGKTTVKEYISKMLSYKFSVHKSEANQNNDIGVSYTLLSLKKDTEALVCELGMNHLKEIERLSLSVEPDIAVITNIGTAHIGELGSRDNIARAKLEIEIGMKGGYTVIWDNEPLLSKVKNPYYISSDSKNAHLIFRVLSKNKNACQLYVKAKDKEFICDASLSAEHHLKDLSFAIAVCDIMNFSESELICAIKSVSEALTRQRVVSIGKYTFYDDSYNSSAEAVIANLKMLSERFDKNSALLGDMLELGEESEKLHYRIGLEAAKLKFKKLYAFGNYSKAIAEGAIDGGMPQRCIFVNQSLSKPELTAKEIIESYDGEVILVKASHSIKIDRIFRLISIMEGE